MAQPQRRISTDATSKQRHSKIADADTAQSIFHCPVHGNMGPSSTNLPCFGFPMPAFPYDCSLYSDSFARGFQMGEAHQRALDNQRVSAEPDAEIISETPNIAKSFHSQRILKKEHHRRRKSPERTRCEFLDSQLLNEQSANFEDAVADAKREFNRDTDLNDSVYGRGAQGPELISRHSALDIYAENMALGDMQLATLVVNRWGKDMMKKILGEIKKNKSDHDSDSVIGGRVNQRIRKTNAEDRRAMDVEVENMVRNDMRLATAVINKPKGNVFSRSQNKVTENSHNRSEMDMDAKDRAFLDMQLATVIVNKGNNPFKSVKGRKKTSATSRDRDSVIGGRLLENRQGACEEGPLDFEMEDRAAKDMCLATMIVNDVEEIFSKAIREHNRRRRR